MTVVDFVAHKSTFILLLGLIGFFLAMMLTPIYTYFAYKYKWWKKRDRTEATNGDQLSVVTKLRIHRTIPRTAGLIILISIAIVTIILNLSRGQTWLILASLIGGGLVGFADDMINISGRGGGVTGIRAPIKFSLITLVAALAGWWFYAKLGFSAIHIPFAGQWEVGVFIIPIFILAVVSTSNAVNISDGVDGLSGGLLISAFGAFAVIAALQGSYGIAGFCVTVVGVMLAYLWFNIPPARFVMGDVGSFSLGTALGVVAMMENSLFLLPIIGIIFVIEAGSSLLQIFSKKFFHRRIISAAPIHHHLENIGWPKTKVTMRFWIIGQAFAVFGVIIALSGGFI